MKRLSCFFMLLVLFTAFVSAQNSIGENFEAGGLVVGGSGYFYTNLEGYFAAGASPYFEVLAADGLAVGVGLDLDADADTAGAGFQDFDLRFDAWLEFVTGYRATAPSGPASAIGVTLSLDYLTDLQLGDTVVGAVLWPHYTFYYFVAPRVAPYVRIRGFRLYFGDYSWEAFTADLYLDITIGLSFHHANKDIAIGRRTK